MTKKKTRKSQQEQFQPRKSKSSIQHIPQPKNRGTPRGDKEKKQPQRIPVYNKMGLEDRRAQEEKYKENFLVKKADEQKRGFRALKYDFDANSQLGDIDQDSLQRRNQNQTIKKIKQLLQEEEMSQNRQRCNITARNQQAKVERLSEVVYERHNQYRQLIEKVKLGNQENQRDQNCLEGNALTQQARNQQDSKKEIQSSQPKSIIDKINQLQHVYY